MAWLELPSLFLFCSLFGIIEEEWVGGRRPRLRQAITGAACIRPANRRSNAKSGHADLSSSGCASKLRMRTSRLQDLGRRSREKREPRNSAKTLGSGSSLRGACPRAGRRPDPGGRNDENNFVIKGLSYSCACRRLQREGAATSDRSPRSSIPELVRVSCIRPAYPRKQRQIWYRPRIPVSGLG
jgi:hypothetical protein